MKPPRPLEAEIRFRMMNVGFSGHEKLLVACSGGSDSTALVQLLHRAGWNIGVAHVNYGLRGEDSDNDARFVAALAASLKIPFHQKKVDEKPEGNIQDWARRVRYTFFEACLKEYHYSALVTAHHAGDNAENILLGMLRGDPLFALSIPEIRENPVKIVRPMLHVTPEQVRNWLLENGLSWREDSSNQKNTYNRNWVRLNVLNEARTRFPAPDRALQRLNAEMTAYRHLLDEKLGSSTSEGVLLRQHFYELPNDVKRPLLRRWLEKSGVASGLPGWLDENPSRLLELSPGKKISLDAKRFIVCSKKGFHLSESVENDVLILSETPVVFQNWLFERADKANAEGFCIPWKEGRRVRLRRPGDEILTVEGEKPQKVKDLLDKKGLKGERRSEVAVIEELDGSLAAVIFATSNHRAAGIASAANAVTLNDAAQLFIKYQT